MNGYTAPDLKIGDEVVVHYLNSEYGSMPTTAKGALGYDDGRLTVDTGEWVEVILPSEVVHIYRADDQPEPTDREYLTRAQPLKVIR
jgi:hypothetical protein